MINSFDVNPLPATPAQSTTKQPLSFADALDQAGSAQVSVQVSAPVTPAPSTPKLQPSYAPTLLTFS